MKSNVALGDSISIDTYAGGPGRGGASLLARNRDDDFPQWRGHDLATRHPSVRYQLLAVDGGTTQTLLQSQLPRLEASGVAPTVVTLTVGGNDLLGAYGDTSRAGPHRDRPRRKGPDHIGAGHAVTEDHIILGTVYD